MASKIPPISVREAIERLASGDRASHGEDYQVLMKSVEQSKGWADRAWQQIRPLLEHSDNRVRSIAGQALCGLAANASRKLVAQDTAAVIAVTRDERFVTARHVLLATWKLGLVDAKNRMRLLALLSERFEGSFKEKSGALVRTDIVAILRRLSDATGDAAVRSGAELLITTDRAPGRRQKLEQAWRKAA